MPGRYCLFDASGRNTREGTFYRLSFAGPQISDEREVASGFVERLEQAVTGQLAGSRMGVFVSGGMDSSSVLTFMRRHLPAAEIRSYSYRCAGESFDESPYAQAIATAMGSRHREVEYDESGALGIAAAVTEMDMPLSDVGLEMASWQLGRAAAGEVDVILTGDGGDEMWASHPVYAAQRLVQHYDTLPIPGAWRRALNELTGRLHDSPRKRDWRVKIKRILPPAGLPASLGPWRWRTYYEPEGLAALLQPDWAHAVSDLDPFACILEGFDGYDGPDDGMSAFIFNDYSRLLPFHFRRLDMVRHCGIEFRFPLYDRALIEFMARVPIRLKLEGIEQTKRLFRRAMEGILPEVINGRSDKLGHSIPLKNWLRNGKHLPGQLAQTCSTEALCERGLFRPESVNRLISEHLSGRHNHSHRIWAIHVLECWLREREGRPVDSSP